MSSNSVQDVQQIVYVQDGNKSFYAVVQKAEYDALADDASDKEVAYIAIGDIRSCAGKKFQAGDRVSAAELSTMYTNLTEKAAAQRASDRASRQADGSAAEAGAASDDDDDKEEASKSSKPPKNEVEAAKAYIIRHGAVEKLQSEGHGDKNNSKNDSMGSRAAGGR